MDKAVLEHFPSEFSQEIQDYAYQVVLNDSRYIFTERRKKQQYGYCTHCEKEFLTAFLRHNEKIRCPLCGCDATVKASGISRKSLIDRAYLVYYEKSILDPEAIIARGIYVTRDYTGDYRFVKTKYETVSYYFFAPGNSVMITSYYSYYRQMYVAPKVVSLLGQFKCKGVRTAYSIDSIRAAIQGTSFRFSTWEEYEDKDMVRFFDTYARYPCIEYLTKFGMQRIVGAKIWGGRTYNAINWNGKTLLKVLRLSKNDVKELRKIDSEVDAFQLRIFQLSKKDRSNLNAEEMNDLSYFISYDFREFTKMLKYTSIRKAYAFMSRQFRKKDAEGKKRYASRYGVLPVWRDYVQDCVQLGFDLSDERVLFPADLSAEHQRTMVMVKQKESRELNEKIEARRKSLQRYCFELNGLMIRPASSSKELIDEGAALHHCVGRYAKRYADGETIILFIRKNESPETPFYTMEIRDNRIIQCEGDKHCRPDSRVANFVEAFKANRLNSKSKRKSA